MADCSGLCPMKGAQGRLPWGIERMPRFTRLRQRQAEGAFGVWTAHLALPTQRLKRMKNIAGTGAAATAHTPATPQIHLGITSPTLKTDLQNLVIFDAYWITGALQGGWMGRHSRKQIDHQQLLITPRLRECLQPPQGGVVTLSVSSGRIQANKQQKARAQRPLPMKPPAVLTIGTEACFRRRDDACRDRGCAHLPVHRQRD